MYHYAGNNPVRYTDPDGKFLINYSNKYILARLESAKVINGMEIDTLVIPPHSIALGNFDGVYTQTGTYHKVTGFDTQGALNKLLKKVTDNKNAESSIDISFLGQINFAVGDDSMIILSQRKNSIGDCAKILGNVYSKILSLIKKEEYKEKLHSGTYRKNTKENEFLKDHWEERMSKDLGNDYEGDWENAYNTDKQEELRTKYKMWSIQGND